ncbi:hypothetical protein Ancab_036376 [Ancistrocladus abbreviatus]
MRKPDTASSQPSPTSFPPPSTHFLTSNLSGGLFIDPINPFSIINLIYSPPNLPPKSIAEFSENSIGKSAVFVPFRRRKRNANKLDGNFLSLTLKTDSSSTQKRRDCSIDNCKESVEEAVNGGSSTASKGKEKGRLRRTGAINTTKHLWAGAVAAMVSRTFVAPLERLKLEYMVRGEQKHILELVRTIAATQGLRGFWKGNFLNILRTAPFKAINFCAYDTYRKQLLKFSANEETSNSQKFLAGAAAGMTATVLCLPLDTIRTRIIAPGGENLGGVIGAFRYMVQNEGFFSLYKGLLPSIASMAPSSAVFYGVYDILKSSYLQSPEGKRRILKMKQQGLESTAFGRLELGPLRTLLYGAIAGACAEAATYPFEVLRRRLQMQVQATRLNTLATFVNIVQQGGIPALYAGLFPSLLQVLPSAATSYFVYEFMKIVLKVE